MAIIEDPNTGQRKEIQGEIPPWLIIKIEGRNEEGELVEEERVEIDGKQWLVVDDGVNMVGGEE